MTSEATVRSLLPTLLAEQLAILPTLRENVRDHGIHGDRHGECSRALSQVLQHLAVLELLVNGDMDKFRAHTTEVTAIWLRLFDRFEAGEPIAKYLLTWARSEEVMFQLATGAFKPARQLASKLGVHESLGLKSCPEDSTERGPALKAVLLRDDANAGRLVGSFETDCGIRANRWQIGCARLLQSILARDVAAANAAMQLIVRGHRSACSSHGRYGPGWNRFICIWGIGVANLAISRGIAVSGVPPLIPQEFLVGDLDSGRDDQSAEGRS